jgi:antitoxin CcdA
MRPDPLRSGKRKPVNVSLDAGIVDATREAGINLSRTCETALSTAAKAALNRRWQEDHRDTLIRKQQPDREAPNSRSPDTACPDGEVRRHHSLDGVTLLDCRSRISARAS